MGTWPNRRQRDGGVDRVPLPIGVTGGLWLCGKQAIGPHHEELIAEVDADVVVCLTERHEIADRYPAYTAWLDDETTPSCWFPTHDLGVAPVGPTAALADEVAGLLSAGATVLVHCAAGRGRSGTFAVCVLLRFGVPLEAALSTVADARPGAGPEAGAQHDLVRLLAADTR